MQENIFRSAIKSGLVLGVLFIARFLITTLGSGVIVTILSWVLVAGIVVAMWKLSEQYRDNENEGFISFGKAFGFTVLSFLYASLISAVVRIIYFSINPDVLDNLVNQSLLAVEQMGTQVTVEMEQMMTVILSNVKLAMLISLYNEFICCVYKY